VRSSPGCRNLASSSMASSATRLARLSPAFRESTAPKAQLTDSSCSPVFCMPESPCFETPTLADRMAVLPSTQVARRNPSKAVVQRRARRARRTLDTVGRLPREQGDSAQGRSQSTAWDHHTFTSGSSVAAGPSPRRYVVARRRKPTIGPRFPERSGLLTKMLRFRT
jgi:hypothetical protein